TVSRNGGFRAVRFRSRRRDTEDAGPRRAPDGASEAAAVLAAEDGRAGGRDLRGYARLSRRDPGFGRQQVRAGRSVGTACGEDSSERHRRQEGLVGQHGKEVGRVPRQVRQEFHGLIGSLEEYARWRAKKKCATASPP